MVAMAISFFLIAGVVCVFVLYDMCLFVQCWSSKSMSPETSLMEMRLS